MGTFLEFYMGLLKFINFKLFSDLGISYPIAEHDWPEVKAVNSSSSSLDCAKIRQMQQTARKLLEGGEEEQIRDVDENFQNTPEMVQLKKRQEAARKQRRLFSKCLFMLGRETPVYILQYLILSFGGEYVL